MLKKIIALLPVLALMLVLIVPARAGAIQNMQEGVNTGVPYAEISDFQSYNTRDYYIMFNGSPVADYGSSPRAYNVSCSYLVSFNTGDMQIEENDGCFEITPLTSRGSSGWQATQMRIRYFTDDNSVYNSYFYSGSGDFDWWAFKYDSEAHTVSVYLPHSFSWNTPSYVISDVYIFESNCDELSTGLRVDVTFTPELSGAVDRSSWNGFVKSSANNLHLSISSNRSIQFCWVIVDEGCSVHFVDGSSRFVSYNGNTFLNTNNLHYAFISDEWNYCAGSSSADSVHEARGDVVKVLSACSWHYLSSSGEYDVSFNQMNLSSGKHYDVVVYAIESDLGIVSCIPYGVGSSMDGYSRDYSCNFSEMVEVYRSSFTLLQSTNYNPDDTSFGVHAFDPQGSNNSFDWDKAEAYMTDDDEMVIRDVSIKDFVENHNTDNPWHNYKGSSSSSSGIGSSDNSYSSLSSTVSGFFGFLRQVISYFPGSYASVLFLGFVAVVVAGIVKAVK